MTLRTFDGAVVVITGAGSGIGRAFAEALSKRGAKLELSDLDPSAVEELAKESGGRASKLDVRDGPAVKASIDEAYARHGRIDYVLANAGVGVFGEIHRLEDQDWQLMIDVNLWGVVNTVRAAYPRMIEQKFGHIVNVASMAGLAPAPFIGVYAMTKHAVVGLSRSLRAEATRHGVRVSALCPGATRTPILTGGALGRSVYPEFTPEKALEWWKMLGPISELAPFVRDAIEGIERNDAVIVLPKRNRAILKLAALFPPLIDKVSAKIVRDTFARFPELRRGRSA